MGIISFDVDSSKQARNVEMIEAFPREEHMISNQSAPDYQSFLGRDGPVPQPPLSNKYFELEAEQIGPYPETYWSVTRISFKCGTKVEYKQSILSNTELQFLVEVFFARERVGEGVGRTREKHNAWLLKDLFYICLEDILMHRII